MDKHTTSNILIKNIYTNCDKTPGLCVYIIWCVIWTVLLIIYYFYNKSNLTDDEYKTELQKLGYSNIEDAKLRYKQLQNEINVYANSNVKMNCNNYLTSNTIRNCNINREIELNNLKKEYKDTKLNDNDKKTFIII